MNDDMPRARRSEARTAIFAVAALLLAVGLSGCGVVVNGTAQMATPELSALDMGDWDTTPATAPLNDNDTYGRVVESARLAEAVVVPPDLDPALAYGGAVLAPTAGRTSVIAPEISLFQAAGHGMIAGYAVSGADVAAAVPTIGQSKIMRVTVLSFRNDVIAESAADGIDAADAKRNPGNVTIEIPGHPKAWSHWRPDTPVLITSLAYRSYVVVVFVADRTPDAAALTARTAAVLTAQLPLLDAFRPTSPDKLSALPLDGDDMLRRLLHPDNRWPYPVADLKGTSSETTWFGFAHGSGVSYGPRGIEQLFGRVPVTEKTSDKDDVERAAFVGDWWLLRLHSAAGARKMYLRLVADAKTKRDVLTPPDGLGDAACFRVRDATDKDRDTRNYCFILDGQYWAVVSAADENTLRRRAAAQYALLVNSR